MGERVALSHMIGHGDKQVVSIAHCAHSHRKAVELHGQRAS